MLPANAVTMATETTWTWMAQSDWQAYDAWPSAEQRAEQSRRKQVKAEQDRQWREANVELVQARAAQQVSDAARTAWLHSDERAAAASAQHVKCWSSVRRLERRQDNAVQAEKELHADARRKRVRRIEQEKEDRDALRELASSRNDGPIPELLRACCVFRSRARGPTCSPHSWHIRLIYQAHIKKVLI